MPDRATLHNELEALADVARAESQHWTAVSDPPTEAQQAAYDAIRQRLVEAGYSERHADWAVTAWILMDTWPVLRCVERCDENGPFPVGPVTHETAPPHPA
jgi:hypothetical protein